MKLLTLFKTENNYRNNLHIFYIIIYVLLFETALRKLKVTPIWLIVPPPSFYIFQAGCKTWTLTMFMMVKEWQASHTVLGFSLISALYVCYFYLRQQKRCGGRSISSILEKGWAQNTIYYCRMGLCRLDFEEKTSCCRYIHLRNTLMTRLESLFCLC